MMKNTMVEELNAQFVNYEQFGAVGDGVADDAEAIRKAHDYANEHGLKVLANPDGKYRIGAVEKSIEIKTTECGPFGLVPSSSTTAMMAMGDAIACLLINLKRLTIDDFYKNHPGGELSKL